MITTTSQTKSVATKKALVLEGGGMRSAYVAGALLAFKELQLNRFDVVIGTSAGSCCAANFLVGRPEFNQYVLEEHLASPRFIRLQKMFSPGHNVVDVDYLMDECFETLPELQKILLESQTKFYITLTNCSNGEPIFVDAAKDDAREAIRASCAMPYLYRRKLFRDGHRVLDGGLGSAIPVKKAIEEGAQEIYVVCSRPEGYRKKTNPLGWMNHLLFPQYPKLARALWYRAQNYNVELDLIENPPKGIKVIAIRPTEDLPVTRITRDKVKVRRGIQQGFYDAYQNLSRELKMN